MATYYVTGGTGFIGGHLLPRLRQLGDVRVLVREGTRSSVSGVRVEPGDVLNESTLHGAHEANVIIHMAAMTFLPDAIRSPGAAFDANARGTLNMLEAARKARELDVFLLMSTAQVYGRPVRSPIDEDHPLRPTSPYGASKVAAEALVHAYAGAYGLPCVIVRPFNIFGSGQAADFLVPGLIHQLRDGRVPTIGDASTVRDFTFVDDFMELLLACVQHKAARGHVFNGGSGRGTRVSDIIQKLMVLANVQGKPIVDPSRFRAGEIQEIVASTKHVTKTLGWSARTSLDEGLRRTWDAPISTPN